MSVDRRYIALKPVVHRVASIVCLVLASGEASEPHSIEFKRLEEKML
jgi:hypothetical protein